MTTFKGKQYLEIAEGVEVSDDWVTWHRKMYFGKGLFLYDKVTIETKKWKMWRYPKEADGERE